MSLSASPPAVLSTAASVFAPPPCYPVRRDFKIREQKMLTNPVSIKAFAICIRQMWLNVIKSYKITTNTHNPADSLHGKS